MVKVLKTSAAYDFISMAPFAVPGLAEAYVGFWRGIHESLEFVGGFPEFEPFHVLFLNLLGIVTILWAALRWFKPDIFLLRADIFARLAIGLVLAFYALAQSTSPIIIAFIPPEFIFLLLLALAIRKARRGNATGSRSGTP